MFDNFTSSFRQSAVRVLRQPVTDLRKYNPRKLRRDVTAGLTVSVVAVPQAMAYALIAGVAPVYGLYTVIVQSLIGSLFNSQRFLSVGPINTQSLLVASAVSRAIQTMEKIPADQTGVLYLELVVALTLMKGVIQLAMAGAQMGNLVRYVSQSVIVGFTAGAGVLIAVGQVPNFLGLDVRGVPRHLPGVIGAVERMGPHLHQVNVYALVLGLLALMIVLGGRMISRLFPGPLLAVVGAAAIVGMADWTGKGLELVGKLPSGLLKFEVPALDWGTAETLFGGALALSMLGLMEAYFIGKTIASKTGDHISANQELFSQGMTNLVSSFFQCIPGSGSFSRSALNFYAGAMTRYSGVFNAFFVAMIFVLFKPWASYIPLAALAAVLFVIAYGLIDWRYFVKVARTSRADAWVCMATFIATLVLPLEFAIFAGILFNIALYLHQASHLHIAEMVQSQIGPFHERPITDRQGQNAVVFLSLEGDLFFGVANELQDRLRDIAGSGVRVVVFRLKRTHMIDATVLSVLEQFAQNMKQRSGYVLLCGVRDELHAKLRAFGLADIIGEDNIFPAQFGVFTSAKAALRRARVLIGRSIDDAGLLHEQDTEERAGQWYYQI